MATIDAWVELARNPHLAVAETGGIKTLKTTAGSAGTDSWIELDRNAKLATSYDTVTGIHTLKVVDGTPGDVAGARLEKERNPKLATSYDAGTGVHTLKTIAV